MISRVGMVIVYYYYLVKMVRCGTIWNVATLQFSELSLSYSFEIVTS